MSFQDLIGHFFEAFFEQAIFYLLFSVPLFLVFWVIWKKKFQRIRIQSQPQATTHHFKHDLWHSGSSLLVFAGMDIALLYLQSKGYTRLYSQPDQYGWWWLPLSFALLLFLNDTFFTGRTAPCTTPNCIRFFTGYTTKAPTLRHSLLFPFIHLNHWWKMRWAFYCPLYSLYTSE
jgi:hypothetical protein